MNCTARKRLFVALASCALLFFGAFLAWQSHWDDYRVHKIDFIIHDNQQGNVAGLTHEQLLEYLQQCGGHVDTSGAQWVVRYDGVFGDRTWTFLFVQPPVNPGE